MVRRWQVPPDESGTMSREALIGAMIDAAALLDIAGGGLTVLVGRERTNLPGEMVMTGAVLEWRDRTDAKAQPEAPQTVGAVEQAVREAGEQVGRLAADHAEKEWREVTQAVADGAEIRVEAGSMKPTDENPDGFKYEKLEAEDIEEPEPVR
jgi:hypothetical protein